MSEDEKDEISHLAWQKLKQYPFTLMELPFINGFRDGYFAGRESLREEQSGSHRYRKVLTDLERERARAEKLVERLKAMRMIDSSSKIWRIVEVTITEYEASRDGE